VFDSAATGQTRLLHAFTEISILTSFDDNLDWALASRSVVMRHFLCAAHIVVVKPKGLTEFHLFEWIFFVAANLVDHRSHLQFFCVLP
jgi:hypothetical protein